MKRVMLVLSIVLIGAATASGGAAQEAAAAEEAAVAAVLVRYGEARTAGDAEAFVALHDPDAIKMPQDREMFRFADVSDMIATGWEREDSVSTTTMEVVPEETVVMGEYAYTMGTYSKVTVSHDGGDPQVFEGKFLTILKKNGEGEWVIYRDSYSSNTAPPEPMPHFAFGTPVNMASPVNSDMSDGSPSLSANGLELYYHSTREGGYGGYDIWMVSRSSLNAEWGEPVNLGPAVNSEAHEIAPTISADGFELYFSDFIAVRPGGIGGADIWVSRRSSADGEWGKAQNLGPVVNTDGEEITPEISPNGLELYFETSRAGGLGSDDLWVSRRVSRDSAWGEPEWLGSEINTVGMDHCPTLSADGLTLFYDCTPPDSSVADLMVVRRPSVDAAWGTPVSLGHPHSGHYAADISFDGTTLYYTAPAPDDPEQQDIWMVPIEADGHTVGR